MASTAVASNAIVLEVLDQHNYEDWSSRIQTYLLAEDLWDVVKAEPPIEENVGKDEYKAWPIKNAKALHAIKVSCGTQLFSFIKKTRTAKSAWKILEKTFKSSWRLRLERKEREKRERHLQTAIDDVVDTQDEEEEFISADEDLEREASEGGNENNADYEPFFGYVRDGDLDKAKGCLAKLDSNAVRALDEKEGCTALHLAVWKEHVDIVKELLLLMTQVDLEIEETVIGYTALHAAVNVGNIDIVKLLVPKMRQEGLAIRNTKGATALHIAAKTGKVQIVEELVRNMTEKDLEIENNRGYTALGYALVARNEGEGKCSEADVIKITQCMVEKNKKILTIPIPPNDLIPVVEICSWFKWDVARYLYGVTPPDALKPPENEVQGASLICYCLQQKKLDIAWDLLSDCPSLAMVEDVFGISPVLAMSQMRSVIFRGIRVRFWQKWIYNSIRAQPPANSKPVDVSTNVSNSEVNQGISIQPPADSNAGDVYINVSNSEVQGISAQSAADSNTGDASIIVSNSEVNQVMLFKRLVNGLLQLFVMLYRRLVNGVPELLVMLFKRLVNGLLQLFVMLYRRLVNGVPELLGINHIYEMKSINDRINEITRCMGKATKHRVTLAQHDMVTNSIFEAIKQGDVGFVTEMCKENNELIDVVDEKRRTIFHMAIECRQEEIFNLIYGLEDDQRNEFGLHEANFKNSMLHSAGTLPPLSSFNRIQGASLQMQRELQWFKEVENAVPIGMHEYRNSSDNLTARELFHKNHEKLMDEAETSMKGMAASCTVVGALIVTIVFAAAFTIPGGNNDTTGSPIFLNKNLFMVFIVSDTISLISSTTSVIIFLGILTSRYAEDDFLKNLPRKTMIGLFTLFISIATMMTAFSCGLVILLHEKYSWIAVPSILVASIPVISFVWMLFPLLIQTLKSTYGHGIFNRKVERWY